MKVVLNTSGNLTEDFYRSYQYPNIEASEMNKLAELHIHGDLDWAREFLAEKINGFRQAGIVDSHNQPTIQHTTITKELDGSFRVSVYGHLLFKVFYSEEEARNIAEVILSDDAEALLECIPIYNIRHYPNNLINERKKYAEALHEFTIIHEVLLNLQQIEDVTMNQAKRNGSMTGEELQNLCDFIEVRAKCEYVLVAQKKSLGLKGVSDSAISLCVSNAKANLTQRAASKLHNNIRLHE
jgi:hypothetical protein